MSEPIPESIPTSHDPRSHRPTKRRALTPTSQQATQLTALFANPDRDIPIPSSTTPLNKYLPPPPEIVANVQGSSAGAGSGEFHVYKASRRREYERVKQMNAEVAREEADKEFESKKEAMRKKDEERTKKNQRRRERNKKKKGQKGKGKGDVEMEDDDDEITKDGESPAVPLGNGDEPVGNAKEEIMVTIHDED